jgi:ABC-type multidrug transport system fused ATPase/permease subunit
MQEGRIMVGGVDIAALPLQKQRRGLAIIPQEPVMFSGTVRENLDPFHTHSDKELSDIITTVGLAAQTAEAGGLDGHVNGFGSDSWSLGQMQLVCLARAALNKVPIVCMDEATAALDPHTEHVVLVRPAPSFMLRAASLRCASS